MREQAQDRREGKGFYIRVFLLLEGLVLAFAGVFYVSCKETLYAGGAAGVQPGQLSAGQPYGEPGTWTGRHYGWLVLAAAAAAADIWRTSLTSPQATSMALWSVLTAAPTPGA